MLAMAAGRTRSARAELEAVAVDLFLPAEHRLTDQQRAIMIDVLAKLVAAVELEIRQYLGEELLRTASDVAAKLGAEASPVAYPLLEAAGQLRDPALLRCVMQRAEEHRLALAAGNGAIDAASGGGLVDALARSRDPELARRAVAYVVAEAKRRDRFREPLLLLDDLPVELAVRLHWQVAAALRRHLLARHVVEPSTLDQALEAAARRALAEHGEGQGGYARAGRVAARLHELGELGDDFLVQALTQGHLALFISALAVRAAADLDVVWRAVADRGRYSLLVLLRAIEVADAATATIIERLDADQPLMRTPAAQRAMLAAYGELDLADAQRLLREWRLDTGYRVAIDDLDAAGA
jgi:uncharacterized protein (DUF2336 family)